MNEYPDWVEYVSLIDLDPLTVWVEYRIILYISVAMTIVIALLLLYFGFLRLRALLANFQHSFSHKMAFYRGVEEMPENEQVGIEEALSGEALVFGFPAVAAADVPGFRKTIGWMLLTKSRLIYTCKGQKCDFPLDSFRDANIHDGAKSIDLKLILDDRKPLFQLLGINRDHAQELFMKMNSFRIELKENKV